MFEFLGTFAPHKDITALVSDEATPTALSFPPDAPFKTLYSVYALKSYLSQQLQDVGLSAHSLRSQILISGRVPSAIHPFVMVYGPL